MARKATARKATLRYDRGTLVLHPPPQGQTWVRFVTWDDRIEKFRMPALRYRAFMEAMRAEGTTVVDEVGGFGAVRLEPRSPRPPFPHQQEALTAWTKAGRRGVVVLPTGAGKTYLAQLAMEATPRTTLIVVPTLDLMHQWYAELTTTFPDVEVGLLGGGSKDSSPVLVATYDSAAIFAEQLGNRYGLVVFDECHHLPSDFKRSIAEYSVAPYRLGLSATPDRADGREDDLVDLIGPLVYHKTPDQLSGHALAEHKIVRIDVALNDDERRRYDALIAERNTFLRDNNIFLGTLAGWQRFVGASARSKAGRAAMLAHREARAIAFGTEGKLRVLGDLLARHQHDRVLIFTDNNATVYRVSHDLLVPAITHQTKVKERHETLDKFRSGDYPRLVTSRVLNEGVDVPDANVAIVLSGTRSTREYVQRLGRILRKQEGKLALLYEVVALGTSEEKVSEQRRGDGDRWGSKRGGLRSSLEEPAEDKPTPKTDVAPIATQDTLDFEDL